MKTCTRCRETKDIDAFNRKASSKDGFSEACRECMKAAKRAAYLANRETVLAQQRAYKAANREKVLASQRATYYRYHERNKAENRRRYQENREVVLAETRAKRLANREEWLAKERETYRRNAASRVAAQKVYYRENKTALRKYKNEYDKKRLKSDPLFALERLTRRRINFAMTKQGYLKTSPTQEMLGCDYAALKAHLERLFKPGMTWENRGAKGWHIDHIIPLASAKTKEDLIKLCHFSNLQPLWAHENLSKGAKL